YRLEYVTTRRVLLIGTRIVQKLKEFTFNAWQRVTSELRTHHGITMVRKVLFRIGQLIHAKDRRMHHPCLQRNRRYVAFFGGFLDGFFGGFLDGLLDGLV